MTIPLDRRQIRKNPFLFNQRNINDILSWENFQNWKIYCCLTLVLASVCRIGMHTNFVKWAQNVLLLLLHMYIEQWAKPNYGKIVIWSKRRKTEIYLLFIVINILGIRSSITLCYAYLYFMYSVFTSIGLSLSLSLPIFLVAF